MASPHIHRRTLITTGLVAPLALTACGQSTAPAPDLTGDKIPFDKRFPYLALGIPGTTAQLAIGSTQSDIQATPAPSPSSSDPLASHRATVVDIYLDFQCPHCVKFDEVFSPDLRRIANERLASVRLHPRPMLDRDSIGYSTKTAGAAAAVYADDSRRLLMFTRKMMAALPKEGPTPDDAEILKIAKESGAGEQALKAIRENTYISWVTKVVEPEAKARVKGTPVALINGENFDTHSSAGALYDAVKKLKRS
ncbi:DsbA family protein [Devriesea agamarum]|uniref:DsbA family protein n=1 Tax=Devriesea agamarum TaxID=472569 RepID=UPI00071DA9F2|nr:thioredoxin domain-containing protein [Devriesea agamarum]